MVLNNFHSRVGYFDLKYAANLIQIVPSEKLNVRTPIEAVIGETPDISEYVDFYF